MCTLQHIMIDLGTGNNNKVSELPSANLQSLLDSKEPLWRPLSCLEPIQQLTMCMAASELIRAHPAPHCVRHR